MTHSTAEPSNKIHQPSDLRLIGPWFAVEFLSSYSATLLTVGCYDFATSVISASPSARLWMSAFWGFAYVFIALFAGTLSEKWGPRNTLNLSVAGSVLTALLGLISIQFPSVWTLTAIMLGYNITSTVVWPAMESAITRSPGRMSLGTRIAGYNLSWGLSNFAAFFTRGPLEGWSWSTVFWVPAASSALAFLILFLAPKNDQLAKEHADDSADAAHELDDPVVRRKAELLLKLAWIGNALSYVAIYVLIPVLTKLANVAGYKEIAGAGMITAIWGFTRFAGFIGTWKWKGWHYKLGWLLAGQLALALSFCLLMITHTPMLLISMQILFGLSTALIYSSSLYYAMHVSQGHGGHAGIHEALIGLGTTIGPAVGALSGSGELGEDALFRIGIGVTAVLVVGLLVMTIMGTRKQSITEPRVETRG